MSAVSDPSAGAPWLLIETSGPAGLVGMARDHGVVVSRTLNPAHRHARDLTPAVAELLRESGIPPSAWAGVMVGLGPGSFTALRVGVMSAKAFAYASGTALRAVPTFAIIAEQTPPPCQRLWVLADALRGHAYAQLFHRYPHGWQAETELLLLPWEQWYHRRSQQEWVSGPGATHAAERWPELILAPAEVRLPTLAGLYAAGRRHPSLSRDEWFVLEPLYIRPSYAEEQRRT